MNKKDSKDSKEPIKYNHIDCSENLHFLNIFLYQKFTNNNETLILIYVLHICLFEIYLHKLKTFSTYK